MERELFNPAEAERAWNQLSEKYSHRYHKKLSAWSRLSHRMRHSGFPDYDGGLLRVIAFFGDIIPDYQTEHEVVFQPGPMTFGISADPQAEDWNHRYLLLLMAEAFSTDPHLHRYLRESTNARHGQPRDPGRATQFGVLRELLASELEEAERRREEVAGARLQTLARMLEALSRMEF